MAEQPPCRSCGLQNEDGRDFCANCGEYLSWAPTAFVAAVPVTGAPAEAISESTSVESSEEVQTTLIGTRPDDAAPPTDDQRVGGPDFHVTAPQAPLPDEPAMLADEAEPPPASSHDAVVGIPEGPPPTGDASIVLAASDPALGAAGVPAVEAGATLSFLATVRNESQIVDNYDLAVLGLPENWAAVTPAAAFLVPLGEGRGQSTQEVQINIAPPREYRSTAGIWTFELIALSRTTATIAARAIAQFEVRPFQAWSVEAVPVVNAGRLKARYRPAVRNDGNAEQELWLIAEPDSPRVRTKFQAGHLVLQAGEVGIDVLTVRPRFPRPVGRIGEHRVGVDVVPEQPEVDEEQLSVKEKLAAKAKEEAKKTGDAAKGDLKRMKPPRLPRLPNPMQKLQKLKGSVNASALARLRSAGDANAPQTARQVIFRQKPIIPLWLIAVIVLAAIAGYVIYTLLPDRTTVPALTGDSFAVEKQLRAKGLKLSQPIQKRTDPNETAGNVIEQTPAAGAKVDKGTEVTVVVADGTTKVMVPRLKDLTRVKADERLRKDGLELGDTQPSDAPDKFIVRSQIPAAGLSVERGSPVRVFLKKPPLTKKEAAAAKKEAAADAKAAAAAAAKKATIVIPPVDDMNATDYAAALTKLKLKPDVNNATSTEPVGDVLGVKPEPGEKVKKGAKVTVSASAGAPTLAVETDGLVLLYDPATSKQTGQIPEEGTASQLSYVPGENQAVYIGDAGLIVSGLEKGAKQRSIYAGPDALGRPSVAPNGRTIAVIRREEGDGDLCFGRIDRKNIEHLCLPDDGWDLTGRIAWRDDGKVVLVPGRLADDPSTIGVRMYSTTTAFTTNPERWSGEVASDISTPGKGVIAAQYSPDGKQVAVVSNLESNQFEVVLSDAADLELAVDPKTTGAAACDVTWRPDGKELAIMEGDKGCSEPLGTISRFLISNPKETTLIADEGRNPLYRPTR